MNDPDFQQLMGIVEVDETYIGGKNSESLLESARNKVALSWRH